MTSMIWAFENYEDNIPENLIKSRTDWWVNYRDSFVNSVLGKLHQNEIDLPSIENQIALLELSWIQILRVSPSWKIEWKIPADATVKLDLTIKVDHYISIENGDALCIPLVNLNNYEAWKEVDVRSDILPQLTTWVSDYRVFRDKIGTPMSNIFRKLYVRWTSVVN
jgi:hypothetical protein